MNSTMNSKPIPDYIERHLKPNLEFTQEVYDHCKSAVEKLANVYVYKCGGNHSIYDDLVQEGWIGVYRACDDYRDDKGTQFRTYAIWKARDMMQRFVRHKMKVVSAPRREQVSASIIEIGKLTSIINNPRCGLERSNIDADIEAIHERLFAYDWTEHIDLHDALNRLDPLTRSLVVENVCKGVTILCLAAVHGMDRRKCSQMIKDGIKELKRYML